MPKLIDRTGARYGRLLVLEFAGRNEKKHPIWRCQCDCGSVIILKSHALTEGTESCGCLHKEVVRDTFKKHGASRSPEYVAWQAMKARCFNAKGNAYRHYGARGVTVCERWKNSFENFFDDMGPRPSAQHSLDRFPNNDGNYEPGNCRWATKKEQDFNKRSTVILDCGGVPMTTLEASARFGVPIKRINERRSEGWPDELAATTPVNQAFRRA